MACRGVHFAITDDDLAALRAAGDDEAVMAVVEAVEERWEKEAGFVCETDKAWDAIHRCLTDGTLEFDCSACLPGWCILGGEQLYHGDDYIVALIPHGHLRPLADALRKVTPESMHERYWQLPEDYDQPKSEEDCEYTWEWFSNLPPFFDLAEKAGRHVIFTVDQ